MSDFEGMIVAAKMNTSLERLPVDVIELIIGQLDTRDTGRLRLTSSALRLKMTQSSYGLRFRKRNVDLTEEDLQVMLSVMKESSIARTLEDLTITGIVYDIDSLTCPGDSYLSWPRSRSYRNARGSNKYEMARAELLLAVVTHQVDIEHEAHSVSLVAAFHAIKSVCRNGKLSRLRLNLAWIVDNKKRFPAATDDIQAIWNNASYLFTTVLRSLAITDLTVEKLDIFTETPNCSISLSEIAAALKHFEALNVAPVLSRLKSLSISISPSHERTSEDCCWDKETRLSGGICKLHGCRYILRNESSTSTPCGDMSHGMPLRSYPDHCSHWSALSRFASLCTGLNELELHYFTLRTWSTISCPGFAKYPEWYAAQAFNALAATEMQHLEDQDRAGKGPPFDLGRLIIRGISLTESALSQFLSKQKSLAHLELKNVDLCEGTWSPVFEQIAQTMQLESFVAEKLWMQRDKGVDPEVRRGRSSHTKVFFRIGGLCNSALSRKIELRGTEVRQTQLRYVCGRDLIDVGHDIDSINDWDESQELREEYGPPGRS